MTPEKDKLPTESSLQRRQKSRATIMAVLLFAFVILIYFISIAKMAVQ